MTQQNNIIKPNEHCFIAGMTQSGKTFLTQTYLANYQEQIYVLDTKGAFNWNQVPDKDKEIITNLEQITTATKRKVIYRPVWEELKFEFYNAFFEFCMKRRNCIIVVDEVMQVCPNANRIPEWYKGALTRGMELGVGVWSLSQRPSQIPIVVMTESTHYFIFKLNSVDDRKRIVQYTGHKEFFEVMEKKDFLYFNTATGEKPMKARLVVKGV